MFSTGHTDREHDRDSQSEALASVPILTSLPPPPTISPPPSASRLNNEREDGPYQRTASGTLGAETSVPPSHQLLPFPSATHPSDAPLASVVYNHGHGTIPQRPAPTHSDPSRSFEKDSISEQAKGDDLEHGNQYRPTNINFHVSGERNETRNRMTRQRNTLAEALCWLGGRSKHPRDDAKDGHSEHVFKPGTVGDRIYPTLKNAKKELAKYKSRASNLNQLLNAAIGLQVFISALITALSAVTTGKSTSVMTSILGGAGTVVAAYLARAKGTGELDLCQKRATDLEKFKRECEAFIKDHGNEDMHAKNHGEQHTRWLDGRIYELRCHFEMLLGNFDNRSKEQTLNTQKLNTQISDQPMFKV